MSTLSQPRVTTDTRWSTARVRAAEHQADAGVLSSAARLCEWLLTDDRVLATLTARADALLGLVPTFEPSGDGRRSNRAVRALEAEEDWFVAYPETELSQIMIWGILLGVAPAIHRQRYHGDRLLPCPEFWHPVGLRYYPDLDEWHSLDGEGQEHQVQPGDGTWLLFAPYGSHRPWARGLWRALAPWVLLKHLAREDFAAASEKSRTTVIESPDGSTYVQRQDLAQQLSAAGAEAVLALAPGYSAKIIGLPASTEQIYSTQIKLADLAITTLIRGGNLSTEVKGGSLAAAESQRESNELPKLRQDAERLSTFVRSQSLVYWAEWNFGDRELAPWPRWPVEPPEDLDQVAAGAKSALEVLKMSEELGLVVDRQAFLARFGLSWAQPGSPRRQRPLEEPPGTRGTAPDFQIFARAEEPPLTEEQRRARKYIAGRTAALLRLAEEHGVLPEEHEHDHAH